MAEQSTRYVAQPRMCRLSVMEKSKRIKNSIVHPPHHPVYAKFPIQQLMNDIATISATFTMGITQPVTLLTPPFDACIKAA